MLSSAVHSVPLDGSKVNLPRLDGPSPHSITVMLSRVWIPLASSTWIVKVCGSPASK